MELIIDGYNLLHATGIVGPRSQPATFSRARNALVSFVARAVDSNESTSIVFDAAQAPPGLPHEFEHRGVSVLFARDYEDADTMIEVLIRAHSAPRRLTVVSSDHRIQRAARRRKARAVDSDVWYDERWKALRAPRAPAPADPRPPAPLSADEVAVWLKTFGDIDIEKLLAELADDDATPTSNTVDTPRPAPDPRTRIKPGEESLLEEANGVASSSDSIYNPFPDGYAEDLLKDQTRRDPD